MSLLLSSADLRERRGDVARSADLSAMASRLAAELAPVMARPVYVPAQKALLSRWGGTCRDCQHELAFDPASPDTQRCPGCGRMWNTETTRRWWIYWYQLWLAERVLHGALLSGLSGDVAPGAWAARALAAIQDRYPAYPNADNVLGPSRPFFSTYLESIWVLHLASAASLLEDTGALPGDLARGLRSDLFRPSAELILDFDEGRSNRQVWNAAALHALGTMLGDDAMRRAAAKQITGAIETGFLADGLWYEGENYHWFTLRGLTWGAQLMRAAGDVDLWTDTSPVAARFRAAFRAPVLTVLPDFTYPARRDSRFGITLRQRRMAELWEIALAEGCDPEFFSSLLAHVYDPAFGEPSDTSTLITEVERVEAPSGVRRGALGWKALLWAKPELPAADPEAWRPGTVHLEDTGLAIVRRDEGQTYISLDYGESGGGHGHPDRLNLTALERGTPWLLDFGTGSYTAPSLAWYRTTLAHNAPIVDNASQAAARGACVGFEDNGDFAWVCAVLPENTAFDGATIQRTVVVTPWYILDVLQMGSSAGERTVALPWHGLGDVAADERGLSFTKQDGARLRVLLGARQRFQVQIGEGYGPAMMSGPTEDLRFAVAVATGEEVTLAACLVTTQDVQALECDEEDFIVRFGDDRIHVHTAIDEGWQIQLERGDPIVLSGLRDLPADATPKPAGRPGQGIFEQAMSPLGLAPAKEEPPPAATVRKVKAPPALDGSLDGFAGEPQIVLDKADQFRRAELAWEGKDAFAARAWLAHDSETLYVAVEVVAGDPVFRSGDQPDPELENEHPDIHTDSIQLYVSTSLFYGWLIAPEPGEAGVRITPVRGTDADEEMARGGWEETERGYRVTLALEIPDAMEGFGFDVMINRGPRAIGESGESGELGARRSGQLVWSGAKGQRLYLAGDRPITTELPWIAVE